MCEKNPIIPYKNVCNVIKNYYLIRHIVIVKIVLRICDCTAMILKFFIFIHPLAL